LNPAEDSPPTLLHPRSSNDGDNGPPSNNEEPSSATLSLAKVSLKQATESLMKVLPENILRGAELGIKSSADINSVLENIGRKVGTLLNNRNVHKSNQSRIQAFLNGFVKKTIPFAHQGLLIAKVCGNCASN
jgi:hypothetical protein